MSAPRTFFLSLPTEIRNQIYSNVFHHYLKCEFATKSFSPLPLKDRIHHPQKFSAVIQHAAPANIPPSLTTTIPIAQVNREIRQEVSSLLRTTVIDIEARVVNFDFSHVIRFLTSLPKSRQDDFSVCMNGTSSSHLIIELCGPYDYQWRQNVNRWTDVVESLATPQGELAVLHRIGVDAASPDPDERVPPELVVEVYSDYQNHSRGAGRLEFDKIFYALLARHEDETYTRTTRAPGTLNAFWA